MNTAIQTQTTQIQHAATPALPARRMNLGAAALSVVLTIAVLGSVVFGMDAIADQHVPMAATSTSVQAG